MIVWITHAKVGHRQAPLTKAKAPAIRAGAFCFEAACFPISMLVHRAMGSEAASPLACTMQHGCEELIGKDRVQARRRMFDVPECVLVGLGALHTKRIGVDEPGIAGRGHVVQSEVAWVRDDLGEKRERVEHNDVRTADRRQMRDQSRIELLRETLCDVRDREPERRHARHEPEIRRQRNEDRPRTCGSEREDDVDDALYRLRDRRGGIVTVDEKSSQRVAEIVRARKHDVEPRRIGMPVPRMLDERLALQVEAPRVRTGRVPDVRHSRNAGRKLDAVVIGTRTAEREVGASELGGLNGNAELLREQADVVLAVREATHVVVIGGRDRRKSERGTEIGCREKQVALIGQAVAQYVHLLDMQRRPTPRQWRSVHTRPAALRRCGRARTLMHHNSNADLASCWSVWSTTSLTKRAGSLGIFVPVAAAFAIAHSTAVRSISSRLRVPSSNWMRRAMSGLSWTGSCLKFVTRVSRRACRRASGLATGLALGAAENADGLAWSCTSPAPKHRMMSAPSMVSASAFVPARGTPCSCNAAIASRSKWSNGTACGQCSFRIIAAALVTMLPVCTRAPLAPRNITTSVDRSAAPCVSDSNEPLTPRRRKRSGEILRFTGMPPRTSSV